jgi:D-aspartate ligase
MKHVTATNPNVSRVTLRSKPTSLILGLGVHGLAIARSLGRRGINVEAADSVTWEPHRYSRYCRCFYEVESLENGRLVEFLIRFGQAHRRHKTVLFITRDKTVPIISSFRDQLSEYFDFNLPSETVIRELMDKTRLPGFLERCDALYPKTVWMRGAEDLATVSETLGFACVLKPALRTHGFKAGIAHSAKELAKMYATASLFTDKVIAQQWVPGEDSEVYFCFVYIGRDRIAKGVFVGRKLRQYPRGTGIAAEAEGCENEFVRRETLRLFDLAGYSGFGSTEFRRDPASNRYYLIEITVGRTDYNVACSVANGVDLPFLGYCDMVDLGSGRELPRQRNNRRWVELDCNTKAILQELTASRMGRIQAVSAIVRSLSPRNVFTLFDLGDPSPFLLHVLYWIFSLPSVFVRKTLESIRGAL